MITQNFKAVVKGDTFGAKTVNISLDITNIILQCQFRQGCKDGELMQTAEITKINANKFVIENFVVDWEPEFAYFYDVKFIYPSGKIRTYFGGSFPVVQNVTEII